MLNARRRGPATAFSLGLGGLGKHHPVRPIASVGIPLFASVPHDIRRASVATETIRAAWVNVGRMVA
jgi:hypothetical protein